jgi:hypothetical protein
MSLPSQVAGAELPLAEVRRAAHDVDTAGRRLAAALIAHPARVPALGAALEHLDSAAGALLLAQHAVQGYLASVGVRPAPVPSTMDDPVRRNWWAERVRVLTGMGAEPLSTVDVLGAALAAAQDGDRDRLASVLAGAEPPAGLALARAIAPHIVSCADLAGHPSTALDTVRDLLPGLPSGVAEGILAGTPVRPWDGHPADPAIAGTVLLAGLLNLLGRKGIDDR